MRLQGAVFYCAKNNKYIKIILKTITCASDTLDKIFTIYYKEYRYDNKNKDEIFICEIGDN